MNFTTKGLLSSLLLIAFQPDFLQASSVLINEIAYSGTGSNQCNGEDWVALLNQGTEAVSLSSFVLHDDKGKDDKDAVTLPNITMQPDELLILCRKGDFEFGIGSSDTVTLLDGEGLVQSSVTLPGTSADGYAVLTYAFFTDVGYKYTATPTPGTPNVYTEPKPLEQLLREQNEEGKEFFLNHMEPGGTSDIFDQVVDIYINLNPEDLTAMEDHPVHQVYVPFNGVSVHNALNDTTIATGGKGRIRTVYSFDSCMHEVECALFDSVRHTVLRDGSSVLAFPFY